MNRDDFNLGLKQVRVKYSGRYVGTLALSANGRAAFSYDDENDIWRLSPAYDLTYSDTWFGEHTTSVDGNGKDPGEKELMNVALKAGMKRETAGDIIGFIKDTVKKELGI